jgi:hypothetical protein
VPRQGQDREAEPRHGSRTSSTGGRTGGAQARECSLPPSAARAQQRKKIGDVDENGAADGGR